MSPRRVGEYDLRGGTFEVAVWSGALLHVEARPLPFTPDGMRDPTVADRTFPATFTIP